MFRLSGYFVRNLTSLCLCGSQKIFKQCCQPYLEGLAYPKTPEKLMRSRYTAFALGHYGQYLCDTWAPEYSQHLSPIELSKQSTQWLGLEIIRKSQQGNEAIVEFKASFLCDQNSKSIHHEISQFERRSNQWLYVKGDVV